MAPQRRPHLVLARFIDDGDSREASEAACRMTPLNPDLDLAYDDIDFLIDEMRDSGEWTSIEEQEARAESEAEDE